MDQPTDRDIVASYFDRHFRVVFWPRRGDQKGPLEEDWPRKIYTIENYHDSDRVGIVTGSEVEPGWFLHDVDIDWQDGLIIASAMLPSTGFIFGRKSKILSHCFYLLSKAVPTTQYKDIDGSMLVELRGTRTDGSVGMQTMVPPSVWSKGEVSEPLEFRRNDAPARLEPDSLLRPVMLTAIGMILAKHLGTNGFGHDPRLAWAGFLLRAGVTVDELVLMGEAISHVCNNLEVADVKRVVESTARSLAHDDKKVKGAPALSAILGKNGRVIVERIRNWLGTAGFIRDARGKIIPKSEANVRRAIEMMGHELTYNEFAEQMLIDGRPLEDAAANAILTKIEIEYRFQPPDQYFYRILQFLCHENRFHPVREYLDRLRWDGIPRIDTWMIEAAEAEDTEYVRAVSSILLIAGVRRVRTPGCKYDEMVVWESPQGSLKSSAAQALCPKAEWFSDDFQLNLKSQQLIEATLGKWIIEASDLAGKRKTEIEQLKAMMSRQRDGPARMAYARLPIERARQFILIGTTNSAIYLTDATGARRFWPITVQRFNIPWIVENRDQMWAEAARRESQGESIRLHESLWPTAERHQERRREIDPWENTLRRYLAGCDVSHDGRIRVVTSALWTALNVPVERRDRGGSLRISDIMQKLGFKRTRVRPPGEDLEVGFVQVREMEMLIDEE